MILYFDKYGTLVKRENEGETWVQGDDQSYSLKAKFYDDTQANITEDTPFIDLSNYVVNCVVEREDKSKTPTLTMNRFDENTGAKVLVDNWWTEINGNISVTIRLVDIVENSVKATGLATITINKGNVPSDTTITNSEKATLEKAISSKEDNRNKTTNVRTEEQASDVLYPSEKAVAKVKSVLTALVNQIKTNLENELQVVKDNVSNNAADIANNNVNINLLQLKVESIGRDIENLNAKDSNLQNQIDSLVREIGILVIGADFVPKTRTIAEISLENDITKQELVEAIVSLFGSAAQVNVGITPNTIPVIQNDGKLPKSIMPISDGLIPGGTIERGKSDTEAIITPSDDFLAKYPDEVQGVDITITTETTKYSSVYFVVKNASNVTILGQENCEVGDWIIAQGVNGFDKIDNVDAVKSVNGMLGNVEIKPKDLILENYATSELDDNNIYPTDSAQTGISKLDKRVKTLEEKETESLPNVVLEIKDLNAPTASEQAVIIQKIKELTNNFTTSLDTTKFNEIVLKNDKTTTTTTEGGLKSIEGATVIVGSGWSASKGYGRFDNLYYDVTDYASYNNTGISQLYIGWKGNFDDVFGQPSSNSIVFGSSGQIITPTNTFTMTNISGSDASNESLIEWLQDNNANITGGVYEEGGETITTPDLRQYSLVSYEHKVSDPTYYKFTFNLDNNTEYEIIIGADETVNIFKTEFARKSDIPTKTSQLTNDSGYLKTESDPTVPSWAKASSKPSYSYSEITGKPTIPTVYNSKITIQKNGETVEEFTLNASSGKTINIPVPTKLNELSNTESKFVSETYLTGALADYAKKEDLESIQIPQAENKVTEEVTISSNTWVEDTNVSPFSYIATINLTNLKASSTSIELLNNNAILFATFGFAIGSVSESSVIIYAMDKPTEDVTLTFEVVNPVEEVSTISITLSAQGGYMGNQSTTYVKFGSTPTSDDDYDYYTLDGEGYLVSKSDTGLDKMTIDVIPTAYIWANKNDNYAGYLLNEEYGINRVGVGHANATVVNLNDGDTLILTSSMLD